MKRVIKGIVYLIGFVILTVNFDFTQVTVLQIIYAAYDVFIIYWLPILIILKVVLPKTKKIKKRLTKFFLKLIIALIFCAVLLGLNALKFVLFKDSVMYLGIFYLYFFLLAAFLGILTYDTKLQLDW